jgi:molybdate transport system permease protein
VKSLRNTASVFLMDNSFPILLSLKCALLSALVAAPWGIVWGWVLARKSFPGKILLQTLLYTPLVLPPVLTGYILLSLLGRNSTLGGFFENVLGVIFILDWKGIVLASSVVAAPFMIQTVKEAVEKVDERLEMVAENLGAGFLKVLWTITLPLAWRGIVSGFFLVFARSIGEFGATIMVAGNIPGKTQTIPSAIFGHVQLGQEGAIVPLIAAAFLFSYVGLGISHFLNRRR